MGLELTPYRNNFPILQGFTGDYDSTVSYTFDQKMLFTDNHLYIWSSTTPSIAGTSPPGNGWIDFAASVTVGPTGVKGNPGQGILIQYSETGTGVGHGILTTDDDYIRFSMDNGVTWSNWVTFKGADGVTPTEAYITDLIRPLLATVIQDNGLQSDTQIRATIQAILNAGPYLTRIQIQVLNQRTLEEIIEIDGSFEQQWSIDGNSWSPLQPSAYNWTRFRAALTSKPWITLPISSDPGGGTATDLTLTFQYTDDPTDDTAWHADYVSTDTHYRFKVGLGDYGEPIPFAGATNLTLTFQYTDDPTDTNAWHSTYVTTDTHYRFRVGSGAYGEAVPIGSDMAVTVDLTISVQYTDDPTDVNSWHADAVNTDTHFRFSVGTGSYTEAIAYGTGSGGVTIAQVNTLIDTKIVALLATGALTTVTLGTASAIDPVDGDGDTARFEIHFNTTDSTLFVSQQTSTDWIALASGGVGLTPAQVNTLIENARTSEGTFATESDSNPIDGDTSLFQIHFNTTSESVWTSPRGTTTFYQIMGSGTAQSITSQYSTDKVEEHDTYDADVDRYVKISIDGGSTYTEWISTDNTTPIDASHGLPDAADFRLGRLARQQGILYMVYERIVPGTDAQGTWSHISTGNNYPHYQGARSSHPPMPANNWVYYNITQSNWYNRDRPSGFGGYRWTTTNIQGAFDHIEYRFIGQYLDDVEAGNHLTNFNNNRAWHFYSETDGRVRVLDNSTFVAALDPIPVKDWVSITGNLVRNDKEDIVKLYIRSDTLPTLPDPLGTFAVDSHSLADFTPTSPYSYTIPAIPNPAIKLWEVAIRLNYEVRTVTSTSILYISEGDRQEQFTRDPNGTDFSTTKRSTDRFHRHRIGATGQWTEWSVLVTGATVDATLMHAIFPETPQPWNTLGRQLSIDVQGFIQVNNNTHRHTIIGTELTFQKTQISVPIHVRNTGTINNNTAEIRFIAIIYTDSDDIVGVDHLLASISGGHVFVAGQTSEPIFLGREGGSINLIEGNEFQLRFEATNDPADELVISLPVDLNSVPLQYDAQTSVPQPLLTEDQAPQLIARALLKNGTTIPNADDTDIDYSTTYFRTRTVGTEEEIHQVYISKEGTTDHIMFVIPEGGSSEVSVWVSRTEAYDQGSFIRYDEGTIPHLYIALEEVTGNIVPGTSTADGLWHLINMDPEVIEISNGITFKSNQIGKHLNRYLFTPNTDQDIVNYTGNPFNNDDLDQIEVTYLSHESLDYSNISVLITLPNTDVNGNVDWRIVVSGGSPTPADYSSLITTRADGEGFTVLGIENLITTPAILSTDSNNNRTGRIWNLTSDNVTFPVGDIVVRKVDTHEIIAENESQIVAIAGTTTHFQVIGNEQIITLGENESLALEGISLTNLLTTDVVFEGGDLASTHHGNIQLDFSLGISLGDGVGYTSTKSGNLERVDRNTNTIEKIYGDGGALGPLKEEIESGKILAFDDSHADYNRGDTVEEGAQYYRANRNGVDPGNGTPSVNTDDWDPIYTRGIGNEGSEYLRREGAITFPHGQWEGPGTVEYFQDFRGIIAYDPTTQIFTVLKGYVDQFVVQFLFAINQSEVVIANRTPNTYNFTRVALIMERADPGEDFDTASPTVISENLTPFTITSHSEHSVDLSNDSETFIEDLPTGSRIRLSFVSTRAENTQQTPILTHGFIFNFFFDGRAGDLIVYTTDTEDRLIRLDKVTGVEQLLTRADGRLALLPSVLETGFIPDNRHILEENYLNYSVVNAEILNTATNVRSIVSLPIALLPIDPTTEFTQNSITFTFDSTTRILNILNPGTDRHFFLSLNYE